jgi:hypothetical protein
VLKSRVAIASITVALALGLTACEKPNPGVTVWSGTHSEHREAVCWTTQTAITPENCAEEIISSALSDTKVGTIDVMSEQTIGISVDPEVADLGWYVGIAGQRFNETAIYETYYRFTFPRVAVPESGFDLQIIAQGKGNATRGIWVFKLVNATSE